MTTANIDNVTNGLNETRALISREEARLFGIQQDLGDALAAHRMGESGAQKRAATLSMDLGKLRSHIETLKSEERALSHRLTAMETEGKAAQITRMQDGAIALTAKIEETEQAFAEKMRQAFVLAKELYAMYDEHQHYRKTLTVNTPEGTRPPRNPGRLFNLDSVNQGDAAIERWLASEVRPYRNSVDPDASTAMPATRRAPVLSVSQPDVKPPAWARGGK